ncbi:MAG: sigma-54 dependent transcriptional regulator [Humidesulfovibrio sp.]|uniref:sigma-54 interaction domain-containing protein n=1 Tax=Humidesulfovibrio sp. TaxID=2910988 RepID=UPI0027F5A252|nr:sigma-54 dependent transcriptional regulator [Humidesulfovibrio sp.]MDQ7835651.1 sigma-54 dependent transcriptional regulator [Humidesulfovibrio sp.]
MWKDAKVKVLVAGPGKTCGPFLSAVQDVHGVELIGLLDLHTDPSSLALAKELSLSLVARLDDLAYASDLSVIVNTTGDERVARHIEACCPEGAVVLSGPGARFVRLLTLALRKGNVYRDKLMATEREIEKRAGLGERMVGKSPALREVAELIERVAQTPTTVLLLGETGVGKDLAARSIHQASHLKNRPFIAVNCTALTATLMESELFGYRRGSFTGAECDRAGLLEEANGGTLFLDEIGDMSGEMQAKLLRFLQTGEVRRVGATTTQTVNVRVIAATNRDLEAAVERNEFRRDLFYRFNTFTITLPPLRERTEDLPYLTYHFITKSEAKLNKKISSIDEAALALMKSYRWPGNVRELENVIERAVILCQGGVIRGEDLAIRCTPGQARASAEECPPSASPAEQPDGTAYTSRRHQIMATFERKELERFLRQAGGNVSEAARISGIPRRTLYRKMKRFGL